MADGDAEQDGDQDLDVEVAVPRPGGGNGRVFVEADRHALPLRRQQNSSALALASGEPCARAAAMNATLVSNDGWFPASWRGHPARQMPAYADEGAVRSIEARLAGAALCADRGSVRLRDAMAELAGGKGFLLQGGDCAESFDDPVAEQVAGIVDLFDAMAERLRPAINGPLVEVARIAGQFAKPRSAHVETHGEVTLPAYRGDIVNGIAFEPRCVSCRSE